MDQPSVNGTHAIMRSICVLIVLFLAVSRPFTAAPIDDSAESVTTPVLRGALLAIPYDSRARFSSLRPVWTAALQKAVEDGCGGLAIECNLPSLLSPHAVQLFTQGDQAALSAFFNHQFEGFSDFKQTARSRGQMVYLSFSAAIPTWMTRDASSRSLPFSSTLNNIRFRSPVREVKWGDGHTSPIMAINDLRGAEGIYLLTRDFAPRALSLNSPQYLTDGNHTSLISRWVSAREDRAPWVELTFTQVFQLERIRLIFEQCSAIRSFEALLRVSSHPQLPGDWQSVYRIDNNWSDAVEINLPELKAASGLRIQFSPVEGQVVRVHEIEVYVRNIMGQTINIAPYAAAVKVSSILEPPVEVMVAADQGRIQAILKTSEDLNRGVFLLPWQNALLFLGQDYVNLTSSMKLKTPILISNSLVDTDVLHAPNVAYIPWPWHNEDARRTFAEVLTLLCRTLQPDGVILRDSDYGGLMWDWGTEARQAFEKWHGGPVSDFPDSVLTFSRRSDGDWSEQPGPMFDRWLAWRCEMVSQAITLIGQRLSKLDHRLIMCLQTWGSLEESIRCGLNWAPVGLQVEKMPPWWTPAMAAAGVGMEIDAFIIPEPVVGPYWRNACSQTGHASVYSTLSVETAKAILSDRVPVMTIQSFEW